MLVERTFKEPSQRVTVTISPANYTNNRRGELVVKNNPRMRLMLDKTLLDEQDFMCDRLELQEFDEKRLALIFKVTDRGNRVAPIKKGSGKADIAVPLSVLKELKPIDFPKLRKAPCVYRFVSGDLLFIGLPVKRVEK